MVPLRCRSCPALQNHLQNHFDCDQWRYRIILILTSTKTQWADAGAVLRLHPAAAVGPNEIHLMTSAAGLYRLRCHSSGRGAFAVVVCRVCCNIVRLSMTSAVGPYRLGRNSSGRGLRRGRAGKGAQWRSRGEKRVRLVRWSV